MFWSRKNEYRIQYFKKDNREKLETIVLSASSIKEARDLFKKDNPDKIVWSIFLIF